MKYLTQCCALNKNNKRCRTLFKVSDFDLNIIWENSSNPNIIYYCIDHHYCRLFSNITYILQNKQQYNHKRFLNSLTKHSKKFILKKNIKEILLNKTKLFKDTIIYIITFL